MPDQNDISAQWQDAGRLLDKWHERARINQMQHYEAAKHFAKLHNALGIPGVILSGIVASAVFATLQKQVDVRVQIAVGTLSVVAAVLAALQTFLRYSERAEKHRSTAAAYAVVRHRLETVANISVALRPPLKELLDNISGQVDSLTQSAPNVPDKVWKQVKELKVASSLAITGSKVGNIIISSEKPGPAATPVGSPQDPYRP
jgi:hypothetical protein